KAGRDAEALGEERIEERDAAAEDVGDDGEREFEGEKADDRIEHSAREPCVERAARGWVLRDLDDRIDDESADIESCDGEERADEAQDDERDADRRARLPDELQEGREVTEGA